MDSAPISDIMQFIIDIIFIVPNPVFCYSNMRNGK